MTERLISEEAFEFAQCYAACAWQEFLKDPIGKSGARYDGVMTHVQKMRQRDVVDKELAFLSRILNEFGVAPLAKDVARQMQILRFIDYGTPLPEFQ